MRPSFLIAISALALAACNKDEQADSGTNAGAGLTAENIVANDITAIDAVTADAANMAADINYADALADLSNDSGNSASGARSPARNSGGGSRRPAPAEPTPEPAETPAEPATNAQ
jgi:hypothetical protein